MHCCSTPALTAHFGPAHARRDLEQYRRGGPDWTTARIVEGLRDLATEGETLLDVGGGVGVVALELLEGGVGRATLVEASAAYRSAAEGEARARGHEGRFRAIEGDLVAVAELTEPAGLVALDRVICCYPDLAPLVRASAGKCRRRYALSYPRERWLVRAAVALQNLIRRLRGDPFRTFVHSVEELEALLAEDGFRRIGLYRRAFWAVAVYQRSDRS